ncbi:class I SAM-dependent methyltransferase [Candidatus Woesearchaeota archaeon]|nr:class I SAM-dependent methyltransferase [Candidatus Woesearchaeota archaeon]
MPNLRIKSVLKKSVDPGIKIEYDKTNKIRPSWIKLKKPDKRIKGVHIKYGKWRWTYVKYLADYFLPTDYNKEDMQKLYDHWSHEYDRDVRAAKHNEKAMKFTISLLLKHCKPSNQKIIDIGCGSGLAAGVFLKNGFADITNLDLSSKMLAIAKKRFPKCKFVHVDFLNFKTREKYDIISSFFSFGAGSYYTPEEVKIGIKKIKSMLKKGGFIVIHGHIDLSLFEPEFKTIYSGTYILNKEKNYKTTYYIGKKR